jgi:hypothetical protein
MLSAMNFSFATTKFANVEPSASTSPPDPLSIRAYKNSPTPLFEKLYRGLSCPVRLLPDFLIIGTQKGGTTSLYRYLQTHPSIASAKKKEVHFFDRRSNLRKGLAWYRGHFPTKVEKYYVQHLLCQAFLTGEATPEYLFLPHIPKRVAQVLPHVKLIVLLRNPVDRAYSQYQHAILQGHETRLFEEAINAQEANITEEQAHILQDEDYERYTSMQYCYLSRGIYVDQLQRWLRHFPRGQFLILKSEDFYAHPAITVKAALDFLNVPASVPQLNKSDYKAYNTNHYVQMDTTLRKRLIAFFEPHNARLYDYLGINFGWDK